MVDVPDYTIDYNDQRFQTVESDKTAALSENDKLYGDMVSQSDKFYQDQIDAAKDYNQQQIDLQKQQNDLAIQEIEQNKQKTERDYQREQSAAYVDWQKQKDDYGVNAEQEAANGLSGSGFSESSQVSFYNTYQNRVMKARESFQDSVQKFDLSITQARLQNNVKLAELAYQTLQKSLELALQQFQNKNQLLLDQANKKLQIESLYEQRRQSVLDQINKENSLAEQIRQFNESMAEQQRQFDTRYGGSSGGGGYSGGSSHSYSPRSSKDSYSSDRPRNPSSSDTVDPNVLSTQAARLLASGANPSQVAAGVAKDSTSKAAADATYRKAVATANKVNSINNQYMVDASKAPAKSTTKSSSSGIVQRLVDRAKKKMYD